MPRISRHRRVSILLLPVLIVPLLVGQVRAIDENLTRGATNNHIFDAGGWGENIDLLNGGLNLTIPIGPEFRVSADLSYRLQVAYSSKIWQIEQAEGGNSSASNYKGNGKHRSRSRLQGMGQAGLGFSLQMGRFLKRSESADCLTNDPPVDPNYPSGGRLIEWVYEDETGASHPSPSGWRGSPDGSYLSFGEYSMDTPDGTRHIFGNQVPDLRTQASAEWPRCSLDPTPPPSTPLAETDIYTNDYRGNYVTEIWGKDRDALGQPYNKVVIGYETAAGMRHLMTSITHVRNGVWDTARAITFTNSTALTAGNPHPMGYVTSVKIPVFSDDPNSIKTAT